MSATKSTLRFAAGGSLDPSTFGGSASAAAGTDSAAAAKARAKRLAAIGISSEGWKLAGRHEASFRRVSPFNQTPPHRSKQNGPKVVLSAHGFCTISAIMHRLVLHRRGI